jgi:hypothetical protein
MSGWLWDENLLSRTANLNIHTHTHACMHARAQISVASVRQQPTLSQFLRGQLVFFWRRRRHSRRAAKFSAYGTDGVYNMCVSDKATSTRHSRRFIKVAMNLARVALISRINSLYDSKIAVCVCTQHNFVRIRKHGTWSIVHEYGPMTMGEMRLRWTCIMNKRPHNAWKQFLHDIMLGYA